MELDDVKGDDSLIEDRRGQRSAGGLGGGFPFPMGKGGKVGIPALIVMALALFLGKGALSGGGGGGSFDITDALNQVNGAAPSSDTVVEPGSGTIDAQRKFVGQVGGLLQTFWAGTFDEAGTPYREAKLVIFDAPTPTGCGTGTPETGPFYCPVDEKVYIDFGFYQQLEDQLGFQGDFAMAYVIAHEWGHHVQNLLGINEEVQRRSQGAGESESNALSVKLELQADCFAGVWAKSAYEGDLLSAGDLDEALAAASAVGDDRIQAKTQGRIDPESFTHGTAEQRRQWFETGYRTADPSRCETFS